jgi:sigma-54 specific flagellar transcriptional regulator A
MDCLTRYAWPGNVRELGNLIERLSILCAGRLVTAADLPPRYRPRDWTPQQDVDRVAAALPATTIEPEPSLPESGTDPTAEMSEREALLLLEDPASTVAARLPVEGIDLRAHVAAIEETLIRQALDRSSGIVAQAARLLGLRRTTLVEKLRKFDIRVTDEATDD